MSTCPPTAAQKRTLPDFALGPESDKPGGLGSEIRLRRRSPAEARVARNRNSLGAANCPELAQDD